MEREVRYCTARDGVRIAYSVEGDQAAPPLMWVPGWVSHVEMDGQTRDHFGWTQILRKTFFVTMDKRGSGLSARNLDGYSIEDRESDIEAVANELGLETFALAGWSEGGPTAISYAAHHPERVKRQSSWARQSAP
jgi:pimeloyl-ACP methyl ester carboxylesterase